MAQQAQLTLILGPSSSGKSQLAESLAWKTCKQVIYIATAAADANDAEWQARLIKHQQRRPKSWQTFDDMTKLFSLFAQTSEADCLLLDSLGTWIANFMELDSVEWQQQIKQFLTSLSMTKSQVIVVGEETGWGVVPPYAAGRLFRDRLGYLSQQVSEIADTTYLVAGGYVLNLSSLGEPLSKYEI